MLKPIKRLLQEEFKDRLSEKELSLLPSSYQKIGNIVIINLKRELWKYDKKIGITILEKIPDTKTVCRRKGFITTRYRKPALKVIAGEKKTETVHKEHGILYKLDVNEIMFAKGNLDERKRISKLVKKDEVVVDMFAGIGYFSIPLAKTSKPKVYSIEINPKAYHYLLENIKLNKVEDKIVPLLGDCVIEIPKLGRIADRVIMGLLPSCKEYLMDAMKVVKPNGIIHYHGTAKDWRELFGDIKTAADIEGFKVELIGKIRVKSYAPKVYHWVLDCRII
ncbi:MAG: class I SAM-dependent methyltransferase family protein [Candidatus Aenigmarchaeota archaeon]|nr:class I SAM-dependent methyltransferase family protein [Candidatus Aenigmarchaeota archaeon]